MQTVKSISSHFKPLNSPIRKPVNRHNKKPSAPAKPEVESFDVSKVKVGIQVSHKMFGVGTVVKKYKSNKYVIVHFKEGEKQFLLPDAFTKGFLIFI